MNQTSVVGVRVRNMDKEAMKKNAREEGFLNLNGTANLSFFL